MTTHRVADALCIASKADPRLIALTYYVPTHDASDGTTIDEVYPEVRAIIRDVGDGKRPWPLFLTGRAGIGKTRAARMLCRHVMGSRAWDLREWHEMTYADGMDSPWPVFAEPPLVVLDEVGIANPPPQGERVTLHRCLNVREHKPLVVISNWSIEELSDKKMYGDPVASRIAAGTRITEAQFGDKDRRLRP